MANPKQPLLNPALILSAVISMLLTVLVLEWYGWIAHPDSETSTTVETLKLVRPGTDEPVKMAKKIDWEAVCIQGYLALKHLRKQGAPLLVVDSRNRGVRCERSGR